MSLPLSTKNLQRLPNVDELRCLLQSIAMLDAVLSLDDGGYYDFDSRWGKHEQVGIMDDGSGDSFFAYFNKHGCFLKGFAHESMMSPYQHQPPRLWPGVLDEVPEAFVSALKEPAFIISDTTFALWRCYGESCWSTGPVDHSEDSYGDGSEELLALLDGEPGSFIAWAEEYYEIDLDVEAVVHVYQQRPLDQELLRRLNPDATFGSLQKAFSRIDYPHLKT